MSDAPALDLRATTDGVAFWIHVTPRARKPSVGGTHGEALRVTVAAPPAEGAANAACVKALAAALDLSRADVLLDPGSTHRRKRVQVRGDAAVLAARLHTLATPESRG